jgi:hypothetical protein
MSMFPNADSYRVSWLFAATKRDQPKVDIKAGFARRCRKRFASPAFFVTQP